MGLVGSTSLGLISLLHRLDCRPSAVSISRFISLGSILAAITFPLAFAMFSEGVHRPTFLLGVIIAGIVILTHRENIARLTRGEERRFSLRRGSGS